jgi:hypothetical protein
MELELIIDMFVTMPALMAGTMLLIEKIKRHFDFKKTKAVIATIVVVIGVFVAGIYLKIGVLAELPIWKASLYGLGIIVADIFTYKIEVVKKSIRFIIDLIENKKAPK